MLLLVGGYTVGVNEDTSGEARGIAAYDFDTRLGGLTFRGFAPVANPSYLWIDQARQLVYAARERASGDRPGVTVFKVARSAGGGKIQLTSVDNMDLDGDLPCHITGIDDTVIVSCYTSGTLHVLRTFEDGRLQKQVVQRIELPRPNPDRHARAHCAIYDARRRRVYVCDKENDHLSVFERRDDGRLELLPDHGIDFPAGAGPRHLVLHPDGNHAVVVCELRGISGLIDLRQEIPHLIDTTTYLPERVIEEASGAGIKIDATGKNVYISERTFSVVTHLRLDVKTARYSSRETLPSGGQRPRDLSIAPGGKWLLSANTKDHTIGIFRIGTGGALQLHRVLEKVPSAACLKWLDI